MDPEALRAAVADPWFDCIRIVRVGGPEPTEHPDLLGVVRALAERWPKGEIAIETHGLGESALNVLRVLVSVQPDLRLCIRVGADPRDLKPVIGLARPTAQNWRTGLSMIVTIGGTGVSGLPDLFAAARLRRADVEIRPDLSPNTWTAQQVGELAGILWEIPDAYLSEPHFARATPAFLSEAHHRPCQAPVRAIVVGPDLGAGPCLALGSRVALAEYPTWYAESGDWIDATEDARAGHCFAANCFLDGAHGLGYLAPQARGGEGPLVPEGGAFRRPDITPRREEALS